MTVTPDAKWLKVWRNSSGEITRFL
jgi:hypothetical protein